MYRLLLLMMMLLLLQRYDTVVAAAEGKERWNGRSCRNEFSQKGWY
jgi:hypothetical protein